MRNNKFTPTLKLAGTTTTTFNTTNSWNPTLENALIDREISKGFNYDMAKKIARQEVTKLENKHKLTCAKNRAKRKRKK